MTKAAIQHRQRAAVYRHFDKLALSGRQVHALEMERMQIVDPLTDEPESLRWVEDGEELTAAITARGIIGVTCQPGDHVFDVTAMQVDGRWCLSLVVP